MIEKIFGKTWMKISGYPPVRRLLDTLGIRIVPHYLYLEKRSFVDLSYLHRVFEEYKFGPVTSGDMTSMAEMSGISLPSETHLNRLDGGELCYVLRSRGKPVGYTWICLDRCESTYGKFRLMHNEAYFFQTTILDSLRRKGLGFYLKWKAYGELEKLGREILYSHVMVFNVPSIGLHKKLKAKTLTLGVSVEVMHKLWFCLPIRRYRLPVETNPGRHPNGFAVGLALSQNSDGRA